MGKGHPGPSRQTQRRKQGSVWSAWPCSDWPHDNCCGHVSSPAPAKSLRGLFLFNDLNFPLLLLATSTRRHSCQSSHFTEEQLRLRIHG